MTLLGIKYWYFWRAVRAVIQFAKGVVFESQRGWIIILKFLKLNNHLNKINGIYLNSHEIETCLNTNKYFYNLIKFFFLNNCLCSLLPLHASCAFLVLVGLSIHYLSIFLVFLPILRYLTNYQTLFYLAALFLYGIFDKSNYIGIIIDVSYFLCLRIV